MALISLPFSELLDVLMESDYYHNNRLISEKTALLGRPVSIRTIQKYRKSNVVPSLENAIVLMKALDQDLDVNDLVASIELEKEKQARIENLESSKIEKHISIYTYELETGLNLDPGSGIEEIIEERANDLYPNDRRAFSKYVRDLIKKDIVENILKENEENE